MHGTITLGDWSQDGHNQTDTIQIEIRGDVDASTRQSAASSELPHQTGTSAATDYSGIDMPFSPMQLDRNHFPDGPDLIPDNWIAISFSDNEYSNGTPNVDLACMPAVGQIIQVLIDERISPSEAFNIKFLNAVELYLPPNSDVVSRYVHQMLTTKRKIRYVSVVRYQGLDQFGYPMYYEVGNGRERDDKSGRVAFGFCPVAWLPLNIEFLEDVEI